MKKALKRKYRAATPENDSDEEIIKPKGMYAEGDIHILYHEWFRLEID